MTLSPDNIVFYSFGWFSLNATIVYTWLVMSILVISSWLITRRLTVNAQISPWQNLLEVVVSAIRDQIEDITRQKSTQYLAFVGTLFLFIVTSNLFIIFPVYKPPTGSLSTTTALALCVFIAVPLFGIANQGFKQYLRHYVRPTLLMLPFNFIGEISRVIALAVRLYGNVMSGTVIIGILLSLIPFLFPIVLQVLGLITGIIQAYIFAILAIVYIASASTAEATTVDEDEIESSNNKLK